MLITPAVLSGNILVEASTEKVFEILDSLDSVAHNPKFRVGLHERLRGRMPEISQSIRDKINNFVSSQRDAEGTFYFSPCADGRNAEYVEEECAPDGPTLLFAR